MAQRIVTNNKNDIITGFDISGTFDPYPTMENFFKTKFPRFFGTKITEEFLHQTAKEFCLKAKQEVEAMLDDAEEIFIEEASLSRWSGNMIDNSVCGMSGKMPTISNNGEVFSVDIRVGVNHKEIMNKANWAARQTFRKDHRNPSGIVYEYNGYRMHPNVDYSIYLENGTAKGSPNAGLWAGFVERAEERFWA